MKVLVKIIERSVNENGAYFRAENIGASVYIGKMFVAKNDDFWGYIKNFQKKYINDVNEIVKVGISAIVNVDDTDTTYGLIAIKEIRPLIVMNGGTGA